MVNIHDKCHKVVFESVVSLPAKCRSDGSRRAGVTGLSRHVSPGVPVNELDLDSGKWIDPLRMWMYTQGKVSHNI